jgi:hypothetical protein
MERKQWALLLVCAVLAAGGIFYALSGGEEGDLSKVMVINLHIGSTGVTENSVDLRYGHPPKTGLSTGSLSGTLFSADGRKVKDFVLWDPRFQMGDETIDDGKGGQVLRAATSYSPEADLLLTLPYTGVEEQFELRDRNFGSLMKSVSLSTAVANFSKTYPEDPSLPENIRPLDVPSETLILAGMFFVIFVLVIFMIVRKR